MGLSGVSSSKEGSEYSNSQNKFFWDKIQHKTSVIYFNVLNTNNFNTNVSMFIICMQNTTYTFIHQYLQISVDDSRFVQKV